MATFPTNPAATALAGDEIVPLTQGAVDKRTTAQGIANLFRGTTSAPIASATPALSAATGNLVSITGTTTITALGTVDAGAEFTLVFADVLILTHDAASLILPTGANITTAAGDVAVVVSLGAGNWRCVGYERADGTPLAGGGGGGTFTGGSLSSAINWAKGSDIASAATTDIGAATGNFVHITGTTTITALGTIQAGTPRVVRFAGILTLTHNAASLILPTAANIVTAVNDTAVFVSEGSGNWRCVGYERASGEALVGGGGGVTGWTSSDNTASPNSTVNAAQFLVASASADADAVITPKGVGAFQLQLADNTIAGGNKRGSRAIDLQLIRGAATQVASGTNSVAVGSESTASGQFSVALGRNNMASGTSSTAIGQTSQATATDATGIGFEARATAANAIALQRGLADAADSFAWGRGATTNTCIGMRVWDHVNGGGYPLRELNVRNSTTNATATVITSNTSAASSNNQMRMDGANDGSSLIVGYVVARQAGGAKGKKSWKFEAHLDRAGGTVALVAAVTPTVIADSGVGWTIDVTADVTNNALTVTVTGAAATTIRWSCHMQSIGCPGT